MSTAERIMEVISTLRPEKQSQVLEFVELLKFQDRNAEEIEFREASLASAMRGMEDEDDLYSETDIKERL